jgi:hypothetical protein
VGNVARTDEIAYAAQSAGYDTVSVENVYDNAWGEIPTKPKVAKNEPLSQEMLDILDEFETSGFNVDGPDYVPPPEIPKNYEPTTIDIVFDPKNIRSTKARFDTTKRNSANILAGTGAAAIGANALLSDRDEYVTR